MRMKKRVFTVVVLGVVVILAVALLTKTGRRDQPLDPPPEAPKVAILTMGPFPLLDMILDEMRADLARSESPKVDVTVLNANFQQDIMRKAAKDMVSGDYAVLVSLSTPATQVVVAENAGRKPLVFSFVSTPSEIGWTGPASLPNVTGFVDTVPLKQNLALVRRFVDDPIKIGYVVNDGEAPARKTYEDMAKLATEEGIEVKKIPVGTQSDLRPAVLAVRDQVNCFFIGPDSVVTGAADLLVSLASEQKKAVFCTDQLSVKRGCLGCVAPDYKGLGRRGAQYVLRIARGERPSTLPVVDFTDYVTYMNTATLKALGLQLPADGSGTIIPIGPEPVPGK